MLLESRMHKCDRETINEVYACPNGKQIILSATIAFVLILVRIDHQVCVGHTAGTFIVRECCGYLYTVLWLSLYSAVVIVRLCCGYL
jgi:hypothetical protein